MKNGPIVKMMKKYPAAVFHGTNLMVSKLFTNPKKAESSIIARIEVAFGISNDKVKIIVINIPITIPRTASRLPSLNPTNYFDV